MNARDNIKPKSIRLAILAGLANGAITTIDDLLISTGEPRKKLVDNAGEASRAGLIKRMKDDVTGMAAYQITAEGKKYLAKYADGSKAEPAEDSTCHESRQVPAETKQADAFHVKSSGKFKTLLNDEVVAQKDAEIASLSRRLREAIAEIETLNGEQLKATDRSKELLDQNDKLADELADVKDELETRTQELNTVRVALSLASNARPVFNSGYVVQRPAKPLARFAKADNAKARAMSFARTGAKAQVFALVPVGVAFPGAEWRE